MNDKANALHFSIAARGVLQKKNPCRAQTHKPCVLFKEELMQHMSLLNMSLSIFFYIQREHIVFKREYSFSA